MIAILGGFGAALCWATASIASARSSRLIGSWATLGWVMLIGPLDRGRRRRSSGGGGADLTADGPASCSRSRRSANVVGLLLAYTAFQGGKVAVIAPIVSTEGAMGAVISILFGEQVGIAAAVVLTAIAAGIVLASARRQRRRGRDRARRAASSSPVRDAPDGAGPGQPGRRSILLALGAVVAFGINLYASARIGATLPIVWSMLPARLGGFLFVALPLLATGRLHLTRAGAAIRRSSSGSRRSSGRPSMRSVRATGSPSRP